MIEKAEEGERAGEGEESKPDLPENSRTRRNRIVIMLLAGVVSTTFSTFST